MPEDKSISDEQLSGVSGGGYLIDARGYEDQSQYAVLEFQPVEDETGLHCPAKGCLGMLHYDRVEDRVWKFHCPECRRIFLKRQSDMQWMGKQ